MTKPKSYVPKERTEQQKAILDEARKRAHAVLREKNKIVKSMKEEKAETPPVEENTPAPAPEAEPEPVRKPTPEPKPEPEPVREPEPEPEAPKFRFDPISGYMLKI